VQKPHLKRRHVVEYKCKKVSIILYDSYTRAKIIRSVVELERGVDQWPFAIIECV